MFTGVKGGFKGLDMCVNDKVMVVLALLWISFVGKFKGGSEGALMQVGYC